MLGNPLSCWAGLCPQLIYIMQARLGFTIWLLDSSTALRCELIAGDPVQGTQAPSAARILLPNALPLKVAVRTVRKHKQILSVKGLILHGRRQGGLISVTKDLGSLTPLPVCMRVRLLGHREGKAHSLGRRLQGESEILLKPPLLLVRQLMRLQGESVMLLNVQLLRVRLLVRLRGESWTLLNLPLLLLLLLGSLLTSPLMSRRTSAPFVLPALSSFLSCRSSLVIGRSRRSMAVRLLAFPTRFELPSY